MTEQEALDIMCDLWTDIEHHNTDRETLWSEEREEAYSMAEAALEEIQQYRSIGTVEEFFSALKNVKTLSRMYEKLNDQEVSEYHKLNQYEAIGTVEECREAREKQKACAPKRKMMLSPVGGWIADCKCGAAVRSYEKYCSNCGSNCGQAVLWEGGDEETAVKAKGGCDERSRGEHEEYR